MKLINIANMEVMRINDRKIVKVKTKGGKIEQLISTDSCGAC